MVTEEVLEKNMNEWNMREDVEYLQDWLKQAENLARDIRTQAQKEGMVSLWHDGMLKVKAGITTPYEIFRNVFSIT